MQNSTLDLLTATTTLRTLDAAALKSFGDVDERAVSALVNGQLPATPVLSPDPAIKTVLERVEGGRPEAEIAAAPLNEATRDFIAARLRYAAARYDAEAKANLAVATVLELQMRKSNLIAVRYNPPERCEELCAWQVPQLHYPT
jgi:hypothetical protein